MKEKDRTEMLCSRVEAKTDQLYRLAYGYVKNEQNAMDIVQESVYKLFKNGDKMNGPEYIDTLLYRITINTAVDFIRRHKKEVIGLPEMEKGKEDQYANADLWSALNQLDKNSSAVIMLHFFEDKTLKETAEILGENVNTVKSRMYQALKILKIQLSEEEAK